MSTEPPVPRILVLGDGPVALPDRVVACSRSSVYSRPADVVLLVGTVGFPEYALAFDQRQRGALVVGVEPLRGRPPELALDWEIPAGARLGAVVQSIGELLTVRGQRRAGQPGGAPEPEPAAAWGAELREATALAAALGQDLRAERARRVQLEDRVRQLGAALDDIEEGVCLLSVDGRIRSANASFQRVLDAAGVGEHPLLDDVLEPADVDGAALSTLLAQVTTGRRVEATLRRRLATGGAARCQGSFSRVHGEGDAVVAVFRDIAAQDAVLTRVVQMEGLAAVGRLAAGVAHEVNNPLAYAVNALEVLRLRQAAGARAQGVAFEPSDAALVSAGLEGCRRVAAVVADLKTLSRPDPSVVQPVDLRAVVDFALRVAGNDLRHRARVEVDLRPVPTVVGNEARLGQVLLNLLYNAMDAMGAGRSKEHRIRIALDVTASGAVRLEVSDTGSGIRPEHLDRVFDPFFTARHETSGTGLGLTIVQDIVTAHGGSIEVRSEVGRGSSFAVLLPASLLPLPPPREPVSEPSVRVEGAILLVDDNDHLRESIRWLLDPIPCFEAGSVQAAVDVLRREDVSAVLCDFQMPSGLGTDLLAWIQTHRPGLAARFVLLTGGALGPRSAEILARAPVPVLAKPFTRAELLAQLISFRPAPAGG